MTKLASKQQSMDSDLGRKDSELAAPESDDDVESVDKISIGEEIDSTANGLGPSSQ